MPSHAHTRTRTRPLLAPSCRDDPALGHLGRHRVELRPPRGLRGLQYRGRRASLDRTGRRCSRRLRGALTSGCGLGSARSRAQTGTCSGASFAAGPAAGGPAWLARAARAGPAPTSAPGLRGIDCVQALPGEELGLRRPRPSAGSALCCSKLGVPRFLRGSSGQGATGTRERRGSP